ncbi:MAG: metallophosphoesterase [Candidatus Thermoplasmatota archaeon]
MSESYKYKNICFIHLSVMLLLIPVCCEGLSAHDVRYVHLSISPLYPTLGRPSVISMMLRFDDSVGSVKAVELVDVFKGFIIKDHNVMVVSGNVTLECFNISINRLNHLSKHVIWYPSVPGRHRLLCLVDSDPVGYIDVDVGFYNDQIVYPSMGCPSIISKDKNDSLFVLLSEKHDDANESTNVEYLSLSRINDSVSYNLYDKELLVVERLKIANDGLEDEIIIRCDISAIPPGFYDIIVKTSKEEYTWPNAVKIMDYTPYNFSFVQLSDIHIGKQYNTIDEKDEVIKKIRYINEYIKPDFIVLSGDMIDWSNKRTGYKAYLDLQNIIKNSTSPIYTIPGNHERYTNRLLLMYMPYTNLTPYHIFINPISDYSFIYGGCNLIFLDSGYDYNRFEVKKDIWNQTPESSGLSNTQMHLLENVYRRNDTNINIIIMHNPAVNEHNDTGLRALYNTLISGNDECIAFNRDLFIDYCIRRNISMVLSGHTHCNRVLDQYGKQVNYSHVSPLFIQTDSATLKRERSGGRIITIKDNSIISYSYQPMP